MNIYSADLLVHATVYIKADDENEAAEIANSLKYTCIELAEDVHNALPIISMRFDNPDLPVVSMSPAVTLGRSGDIALAYECNEGSDDE